VLVFLATLFVFLHEGFAVDYGYHHVGCFKDKGNRAMPFIRSYLIDPIRKCAERAKKDGFTTFGLQNGHECYGGPEASNTYNKYGRSKECSNGVGGSWTTDVYQWKDYIHVGCYKGNGLTENLGTISKGNVVTKCAALARKDHYAVFAIRNGNECWSGPNAEREFDKYGKGTGCKIGPNGQGTMLSDVYSFKMYRNIGCYKDNVFFRAIPWIIYTIYPTKTAVANCAARARSYHAIGFAVQLDPFGRQCYYIKDKHVNYGKYGRSDNCGGGGVGGFVANDVYLFY